MAMTVLDYNGVRLHNVQIVSVQQSVEYDASRTDQLFVRTQLTVHGVVFLGPITNSSDITRPNLFDIPTDQPLENNPGPALRPPLQERSPREIVAYLSQPRRRLRVMEITLQGVQKILWDVLPAQENIRGHGVNTDVDGGPKPLAVNITNIAKWGYEVEFQIQFAQQPRTPEGIRAEGQPNDWAINNRWRVREALDENFFMTRTYEGVIRLTQAVPAYQVVARALAFPQLEPGFKRESCEYTVSADGLEVQYAIVDRQEAHAPPWPCTKMEVSHSETLSKYGYYVQSACQVRLYGPPGVPKSMLLARLAQILRNRLLWDGQFGKSAFLESLRIVDTIGPDNTVFGEMILNRFPNAAVANGQPHGAVADPNALQNALGAGLLGAAGAAVGGIIGRFIAGGKAKDNPGNAPAPPPPNDWFVKLTRNVLGTDLELPPIVNGGGFNPLGAMLQTVYGKEHSNYWQHIRPLPLGYTVFGTERPPAVMMFFACYYQVPERPPHKFHPDRPNNDEQGPLAPPNNRQAPQQAVAPPAEPKQVTTLRGGGGTAESVDLASPGHAAALYTHATLMNDYDLDRGRVVFARSITGHYGDPMLYDDGQADLEVITVSRPTLIRRISYEAERIGTWPEIPWPADYDLPNGARAKLLRCRIQPLAPTLAPDGVHLIYRVHAQYEWAITRALAGADLDVASLPHVRSDAVQPFVLGAFSSSALLVNHGRQTNVYGDMG